MKTNLKIYRLYIFIYGVISLLQVLKHFELEENYEECQKIIDAIKEHETSLEIKLFTLINKENIDSIINEYKINNIDITYDDLIKQSEYYSTIIIEEIHTKYNE